MKLLAMLMMAADPTGEPLPDVVLLDFTASWCQPCQEMVPVLQRMEQDGFPIRRIDMTQDSRSEQPMFRQYNVDAMPTFILLVEGKETKRIVGLTSEQELRQLMNDAARRLDMQRRPDDVDPAVVRTAETNPETVTDNAANGFSADESPAGGLPESGVSSGRSPATPAEQPKRRGISGIFANIRDGLTGSRSQPPRFEHPTFRGQSPDSAPGGLSNPLPLQASVRVTVHDGNTQDFATGTIVHSVAGQSTILTCAHVFHNMSRDAITQVELFRDGKAFKYPATVVGGDKDSDLAFLQIATAAPLPSIAIVDSAREVLEGDDVFSIGCSNGNLPTPLPMKIVSLNRYLGPSNIVCTQIPQKGRSGGGLFNEGGQLIGVCSAADREQNEGLYMASAAIRTLITKLNLQALFEPQPPSEFQNALAQLPAPAESPFPELEDDDLFEQIFNDDSAAAATNSVAAPQPGRRDPGMVAAADPFASPPPRADFRQAAPAAMTASAIAGPAHVGTTHVGQGGAGPSVPQEITVIIDSKDPAKPKQVIVIPRPSPWLLQVLTGESPVVEAGMTTARNANLRGPAPQLAARKPLQRVQAFPVAGP